MEKTNDTAEKIVPSQKKGTQTGANATIELQSLEEATKLFKTAKYRLLDINQWDKLCGAASATFQLTDKSGNNYSGPPRIGDLIRIDLPGPGTVSGEGYDWVRIEAFEDKSDSVSENESFAFRVRPIQSPDATDKEVSHFYTDDATSSFIIKRDRNRIEASEKGRNEKTNTDAQSFFDKIRNVFVAAGAKNGLAYPQWKSLVEGLIQL